MGAGRRRPSAADVRGVRQGLGHKYVIHHAPHRFVLDRV